MLCGGDQTLVNLDDIYKILSRLCRSGFLVGCDGVRCVAASLWRIYPSNDLYINHDGSFRLLFLSTSSKAVIL